MAPLSLALSRFSRDHLGVIRDDYTAERQISPSFGGNRTQILRTNICSLNYYAIAMLNVIIPKSLPTSETVKIPRFSQLHPIVAISLLGSDFALPISATNNTCHHNRVAPVHGAIGLIIF